MEELNHLIDSAVAAYHEAVADVAPPIGVHVVVLNKARADPISSRNLVITFRFLLHHTHNFG